MDFVLGGVAAMGAGLFSNPLDVVKTRMQLQGELRARGRHAVHYRSVPHALVAIARTDGVRALQKGLGPALAFQLVCNSTRLGIYETAEAHGLTRRRRDPGRVSIARSCACASVAGITGAFLASPLYLVKTQMQSSSRIGVGEVGHQHAHASSTQALARIFGAGGVRALWRGAESAVPRAGVGSAVQLTAFNAAKEFLHDEDVLRDSPVTTAFVASNMSGVAVAIFMCPFDVIATRLYNQEVDAAGKGRLYTGVVDCGLKIIRAEGFFGVYKGIGPFYLRVAPHTVLCLVFWDRLKSAYRKSKGVSSYN